MQRVIPRGLQLFFATLGFALVGPFFGSSAFGAAPADPQIQNLLGRFTSDESLILSYQNLNRAFLYDQALAVMAFSQAGERGAAEKVLTSLAKLQAPDGSWVFQYMSVKGGVEPAEEKTSPTGAIAWVAMALESYEKKFSSQRYHSTLTKTLSYLEAQQVKVVWAGKVFHPVRFSPDRGSVVAFEHNLDTYAAFSNAGTQHYTAAAADIRKFLESMWDERRFHAGFDLKSNHPNRDENYLDTQSWGILALGTTGMQGQRFVRGLQTNCEEFISSGSLSSASFATSGSNSLIDGFVAYHPRGRAPASTAPVWSEGSFGMLLSMRVAGLDRCGDQSAAALTQSLDRMSQADGGVPYATASKDPDFSSASSVAGTAWRYFLRVGYNPFKNRI